MKIFLNHKSKLANILLTFLSYIILSTSVYYTCSNDLRSLETSFHSYSCCTAKPCCDKLEKTLRVNYFPDSQREVFKVKLLFFNNSPSAITKAEKSLKVKSSFFSVPDRSKLDIYKINCIYNC